MLKEPIYKTIVEFKNKQNKQIIYWDEVPGEYPGVIHINTHQKEITSQQIINQIKQSTWLSNHKQREIVVIFPYYIYNISSSLKQTTVDAIVTFLSSHCIIREIHGTYPTIIPDNCILRVPRYFWNSHCGGGWIDHLRFTANRPIKNEHSDQILERDIKSYDFFDLPGIAVYTGLGRVLISI